MKKIKTCLICEEAVARSLAYQAEFEGFSRNPITGKREIQILKGLICPVCNKKCGYKTNKKKLAKYEQRAKKV